LILLFCFSKTHPNPSVPATISQGLTPTVPSPLGS
jgi:hypothetical protein